MEGRHKMGDGEARWCMLPQTNPSSCAYSQTVWKPALNKQTTKGSLTPGVSLAGEDQQDRLTKHKQTKYLKLSDVFDQRIIVVQCLKLNQTID